MIVKQRHAKSPATQKRHTQENILGPGKVPVQLQVNGKTYNLNIEPRRTLLNVLRDDLHLTGTKKVCDMGECGACTIIMDDQAVYSCLLLAVDCQGHQILTIEGLAEGTNLDPIQQAFIDHDSFQCGFCTPGQIMALRAFLENNPNPTPEDIRIALSGNVCRCGAYPRILAAAEAAAKAYAKKRPGKTRSPKKNER